VNVKLAHASGACTRLQELFSWQSQLKITENPRPLRDFKNEILFDSVSFFYPDAPEKLILQDVSFKVQKGQTLAIVGASGAGKSSLVHLLPRIYDVSKGSIRIDGTDIREFDLNDLRDQIAIVSQDVFLFNDTIEANIRCGRLSASFDEVKRAAERAFALEFIESSPFGFKTVIGERGQKLSGGQKQRLAIARAFLRNASILILDEATSALDNASEKAVQVALSELMKDRTTLVIAHRLTTIQDADRIIVLHQGKVIEEGTHADLMSLRGQYYRLQQQTDSV
jgi:ABC-type multidrug transport system fused ATPase/permease subunit